MKTKHCGIIFHKSSCSGQWINGDNPKSSATIHAVNILDTVDTIHENGKIELWRHVKFQFYHCHNKLLKCGQILRFAGSCGETYSCIGKHSKNVEWGQSSMKLHFLCIILKLALIERGLVGNIWLAKKVVNLFRLHASLHQFYSISLCPFSGWFFLAVLLVPCKVHLWNLLPWFIKFFPFRIFSNLKF